MNTPAAVPSADKILMHTWQCLGVPPQVIKDKKYKTRQVTYARHVASYILKKLAFMSDSQVAMLFDLRRESISLTVKRIEERAAEEPEVMNQITGIIEAVQGVSNGRQTVE